MTAASMMTAASAQERLRSRPPGDHPCEVRTAPIPLEPAILPARIQWAWRKILPAGHCLSSGA